MRDPYEVLGIRQDATDTEVKNAYRKLARQYHPDNFAGDPTQQKWADDHMKEINEAYDAIQELRRNGGSADMNARLEKVRNLIRSGKFADADRELNSFLVQDRTAEWHYLKSVVLTNRGWVNDAMRELETACQMDPNNTDYQQAKQMFNQQANNYGNPYYNNSGNQYRQQPQRQGGCSGCDVCQGLICADCCCELMGGDLIRCC